MILVTGGTGLLGSHLLMRLTADGHRVRAIYRTDTGRNAVDKCLRYYHTDPDPLMERIDWVEGDVLDVLSMETTLKDVTQVYHCAAEVSFQPSGQQHMNHVNVDGTANVVNACLNADGVRLCHVSSVAAIGRDGTEKLISEQNEWKESRHNAAYAVSKHRGEMEVRRGMAEGLDAFIVNPSLILGPGSWTRSTGVMFSRVWKGLPFYTRGGNCFVDARCVADAMVALMESGVRNERFIIGAENRLFKEIFGLMAQKMGKRPPRFEASPRMAEMTWRVETILSRLSGKRPFITRETAHHAMQRNRYDNSKLLKALPGFRYRNLDDSLGLICEKFLEDQLNGGRH